MKRQLTYYKDKLSKYLLAITLFFSVFVFSPYNEAPQAKTQQSPQTELVLSKGNKTFKRIISFQKAFQSENSQNTFQNIQATEYQYLLNSNRLNQIAIKCNSKRFLSFKIPKRFVQIKTFPQASDEHIS